MPLLRQTNSSGFAIYSVSLKRSDHQNGVAGSWAKESISHRSNRNLGTPLGSEPRRRRGSKMPQKKEEGDAALKNALESAESFSDDVSVRRERGKLAQRAFRQRQIDMIRILKDENVRLKEVISNISASAYRGPRELKDAIDEACRVAEVNPGSSSHYIELSPSYSNEDRGMSSQGSRPASEEPLHTTIPMIDHGSYSWPGPHMDGHHFMDELGPPALDGGQFPFESSDIMSYINSGPGPSVGAMGQMPPMSAAEMQTLHISEQASPHSQTHTTGNIDASLGHSSLHISPQPPSRPDGYSIMASPGAVTPNSPPGDVLPYLGARAYTVAGQVFWQTLRYAWHILKTFEQSQPTPSTDTLGAMYRLFHMDAAHCRSVAIIKDHIAYRLALRDNATAPNPEARALSTTQNIGHQNHARLLRDNQAYTTSGEDDLGHSLTTPFLVPTAYSPVQVSAPLNPVMESLMAENTKLAGLDPHSYLNPFPVDGRLRQILSASFHNLEATLSINCTTPTTATHTSHNHMQNSTIFSPHASEAERMLHTLAKQAVFFADGPRWHIDTVNTVADIWTMRSNNTGPR